MSESFYKLNNFDLVLIAIVICTSLSLFLFTRLGLNWQFTSANKAYVFNNGRLLMRLKLDNNRQIPLLGGKMLIEIKKGQIRIIKSDCPKNICVNTGWINTPGQIIVCLPNKILIQIYSTKASVPILDAVVN